MTQISRYPVTTTVNKQILQLFRNAISSLKQSDEIDDFLEDFLSPVEKIMLAKRLAIAVMLAKGYDYQSIKAILHVTPSTIASVSIRLKYAGKGYKKTVEKILQEGKINDFWQKVDLIISSIPQSKGTNRYQHKQELENKKRTFRKAF
ncbi:MAG: hypothetical protein KatS3mg083_395 [Candidatus Dojkabacteria bacterium]|nr:MAG: hypothetical protein KatS3mg083_395 [Candidatus Dojkabacteria bacterium]